MGKAAQMNAKKEACVNVLFTVVLLELMEHLQPGGTFYYLLLIETKINIKFQQIYIKDVHILTWP